MKEKFKLKIDLKTQRFDKNDKNEIYTLSTLESYKTKNKYDASNF
jgi:hypothetical protein